MMLEHVLNITCCGGAPTPGTKLPALPFTWCLDRCLNMCLTSPVVWSTRPRHKVASLALPSAWCLNVCLTSPVGVEHLPQAQSCQPYHPHDAWTGAWHDTKVPALPSAWCLCLTYPVSVSHFLNTEWHKCSKIKMILSLLLLHVCRKMVHINNTSHMLSNNVLQHFTCVFRGSNKIEVFNCTWE